MINKVLAHVINNRLSESLTPSLRQEQAGFRARSSCIDHVNTLRIIVEQSAEYRTPLYMCFIDFEKAFDTLNHKAIWAALECKGVPTKVINLIKELYNGASCRIIHENLLSKKINIQTGVRQGCVLSPLLFNLTLDTIMNHVASSNTGITWGLQGTLGDLDYADDICLLAHKYSHIETKLQHLSECAAKAGLRINITKTKLMSINTDNIRPILLNGRPIEVVDSFCYLGSIIASNGGTSDDIRYRIKKGRASFGMLNNVWRSTFISKRTKLKIFEASVKSVILYGCETWHAATREINALQVFINRCLRQILRIFWPNTISNEALWAISDQVPIRTEIRRRKWNWIGHTLRKPSDNITRKALDWNPQGSRRKGRPANTWRRLVESEGLAAGRTWREIKLLALDKSNFKLFVDALCST